MATEVILPKVDMDMATGIIAKWHVKNGDAVKAGAVLFEMETDKSAIEIEAPSAGIIGNLAAIGQAIDIGTVVALIYATGEAGREIKTATRSLAAAEHITHSEGARPHVAYESAHGTRATPLARALARRQNIMLNTVKGSGPHGRIHAQDVVAHRPSSNAGAEAAAIMAVYQPGSYEVKPLGSMRRVIAQRITLAKQTIPHFYLSLKCNITKLLLARQALNDAAPVDAAGNPQWKLSINDYIIKAMALALQRAPAANVTFTESGILQHRSSDVGVAVAVLGGLYTPIIREADTKSLIDISNEMKQLSARAKLRKLLPMECQGGSTAISNLGMFGIEQFTAIISPPQATMLAVGAGVETFVPVHGQPVLSTLINCTLSCDHRAIDGALGAALLAEIRQLLEQPEVLQA